MNFWWLQPGWDKARCASCGVNIKQSGGDPDWGYCYDCFQRRNTPGESDQDQEPVYSCDICGKGRACANENGYAVCSKECADKTHQKEGKK